jgi:hypothetical protein
MTTVNRKIEQALSDLVNGNIWPMAAPEDKPDEYITYNPEYSAAEDFGDDIDAEWMYYMQIHYIKQGNPNTLTIRKQIRSRLRSAGFMVTDIDEATESGKLTHLVFLAQIEEEDPEDKTLQTEAQSAGD